MNSFREVQQLLLRYGIITYIGDRLAEIELSLLEIEELHQQGVLDRSDYQQAVAFLLTERDKIKEERESKN
ncbi:YqgQ family protein [Amphibacillus sediminis]|uniref:YqgQ family protein n=1 Tax=Amphibacillus sediminis TaxID=360185 RepID=UPI00082F112F|nr:YqgQ family protein [Amphibacillus sediminis]